MRDITKKNIALAGAAAVILGVSAASAAVTDSKNSDMRIVYLTEAPYTEEATQTSADVTVIATVLTENTADYIQSINEDAPIIIEAVDAPSEIVYVSSSGKYHARSDCSGMKNFTEMSLEEAVQAGKSPCGKCFESDDVQSDNEDAPIIIETADAPSETVYVSASGKYHTRSDCSGMKSFTEMSLEEAVQAGKSPCGKCFEAGDVQSDNEDAPIIIETADAPSETVYVSASGKYHTRSDCSGMKNYTEMSLEEAVQAGNSACKKCAADVR